ncbi:MAG: tRNA (adenosine(37)-N6)-threonylcarbamoyltransferase complex dimerization subunit type 1 TsaB [Eubacteriales bacterium]|nr:tRNA (adenosine(37)-N6)-threonylcarbamoyltransferase complex dimerization subunit type 1 TsaB [Eubacteriales bacterium]
MRILGLDSSGLVAGVALVEDSLLIGEYTTDYKKTHSQTLLPMLDELKRMVELDLHTIDAIAVAAGPGSFTGLRIGSATAKGLGLALDIPVAAVPTVDALAYNLYGAGGLICPLMDARRGQVYTGIYTFAEGKLQILKEQCAMAVEELAEELGRLAEKRGQEIIFLGDGVPVYREKMQEILHVPHYFAPASCNRQRAACVAVLGEEYARAGRLMSADVFAPEYLRLSQAERERMEADEAHRELMRAGITR